MKRSSSFGFEPGNLTIRISGYHENGSGYFWFYQRDTVLEDEEGQNIISVQVPHSELLALRDHLNKAFPAKPFSTYPEDRAKLLALARKCELSDDANAIELGDLVRAILEDEAAALAA